MTRWEQLRAAVEKTREERKKDWVNALIRQMRRAVGQKICADFEVYRVKKTGRTIGLTPRNGVTVRTVKADVPAISLRSLPAIEDAKLTFRVILQADEKTIEQYTVSVVGTEKSSGRSWYVRLDLDAEQKGEGPCSHALLHSHVGVDPMDKTGQPSRVPLPWLDPDEALEWVLATLDRRLEPPLAG